MFSGYSNSSEQWSRLITHLCAPGFQLLAGMGLALSVARSQQSGKADWKISLDLVTRGVVLILAEFVLMYPIFKWPYFFMVLSCIGVCTLCFEFLRHLPRFHILLIGLAIILGAPFYGPEGMKGVTGSSYFYDIWWRVGFGKYGILYPVLPWLGIFAIGWWIGLKLADTPKDQDVGRSAKWFLIGGLSLSVAGIVLRWSDLRWAESFPLQGASFSDGRFWTFTKYPPSLVFTLLTVGILLMLLGVFRYLLDRPSQHPFWARIISVFGRTALFFYVGHYYLIKFSPQLLEYLGILVPKQKLSYPQVYLYWFVVVLIMWPICFGYDKLRQRFRLVLRYF
jgi:uncharacterized membrane protein